MREEPGGIAMDGGGEGWDDRILVSRSEQRPMAELYGFNLREPIPRVPLPLQGEDRPPIVDLQALLSVVYDEAGYHYRLGYRRSVPEIPSIFKIPGISGISG